MVFEHASVVCDQCDKILAVTAPGDGFALLAQTYFRLGLAEAGYFSALRHEIGLTAAQVAALLEVRRETVGRWETAHGRLDRAAWIVLGMLLEDRLAGRTTTEDRLRAALHPPPLPTKTVTVTLPLYAATPVRKAPARLRPKSP